MRSACLDSAQEDKNYQNAKATSLTLHKCSTARDNIAPSFFYCRLRPDRYEEMLARVLASARRSCSHFVGCSETERHASPPTGYRQRLGLGIYDANFANTYRKSAETDAFEFEDGLAYVYWDSGNNGNMVPIKSLASQLSRSQMQCVSFSFCGAVTSVAQGTSASTSRRCGVTSSPSHDIRTAENADH